MEPVKQKRKYTRKPKIETTSLFLKNAKVEEVIQDIEDLSMAPKLERQTASPDHEAQVDYSDPFNSVKPDQLAPPAELKQTAYEILSRAFRKAMTRTDIYFYTEDPEPDMNKYCSELQNELIEQGLGSQFVVYSDPKLPKFHNANNVTNCFTIENKAEPFWKFTLGQKGSKAVNLKEMPRKSAKELIELIKEQTTAYSDNSIDLFIIGAQY